MSPNTSSWFGSAIYRMRGLILCGLAVAAVRYTMEWVAPEYTMWFGVYYLMPIFILWFGRKGVFTGLRFWNLVLHLFLLAVLVWALPNFVAYLTAQFQGWTHGRFGPGRGVNIAETIGLKILTSLGLGALTALPGTLWCLLWWAVLVKLPATLKSRRGTNS